MFCMSELCCNACSKTACCLTCYQCSSHGQRQQRGTSALHDGFYNSCATPLACACTMSRKYMNNDGNTMCLPHPTTTRRQAFVALLQCTSCLCNPDTTRFGLGTYEAGRSPGRFGRPPIVYTPGMFNICHILAQLNLRASPSCQKHEIKSPPSSARACFAGAVYAKLWLALVHHYIFDT